MRPRARFSTCVAWLGAAVLTLLVGIDPALAEVAPTGTHYAGRSSNTGHSPVSGTGGYSTSLPLDLPPVRASLQVPVAITSGGRGVSAAGLNRCIASMSDTQRTCILSSVIAKATLACTSTNPASTAAAHRSMR